jgi:hypothetical protein
VNDVPPLPLLAYELTTDPDPPQASPASGNKKKLDLIFVVSPPERADVYCERITFHFDIGQAGSQSAIFLTTVGDGINTTPPFPQGKPAGDWELDEDLSEPGTYSFIRTTDDTKVSRKGYVFTIGDIEVSSAVGTAKLTVTELSSTDGSTSVLHQQIFEVPKFPWKFGSVAFTTDDTSVEPSTGTTLHWEGDDTGTYELLRNGKPMSPPFESPRKTGALNKDTVFTLRVGAPGVKVKRDYYVTVFVRNPVVELMGPKGPVRSGEPVALKWHTESVHHCFIKGPGLQHKKIQGLAEVVVRPKRAGNAEWRLSGTTASGNVLQDEFTIEVLPPAPAAKAQLVLIKTSGNKDGKVAVRVADGESRFQTGPADMATGWAEADSASGTLAIANYQRTPPSPDLVYVKTPTTQGGWVEFHVCVNPQQRKGGDQKFLVPLPWWLVSQHLGREDQPPAAPSSTWLIAPMGDPPNWDPPVLNVVAVRTAETTGNVEIWHSTLYKAFSEAVGPWATAYPIADASKGRWLLADMDGDGLPPDLVFVQTTGTKSKHVELTYATGSSRYTQLGPKVVTGFTTKEAANGSFHLADMTGDKKPDLVFVKTARTKSKLVEIYWVEAANEYKKRVGGFTKFDLSEGSTGTWRMLGSESPFFTVGQAPDPKPVGPRRNPRMDDPRFAER